jgi:calcium binding protein 39
MPLFGKSQKSPAEVVKALKEAVNALERGDKKAEKVRYLCLYVTTRLTCTIH